MSSAALVFLALLAVPSRAETVSPVMKVVELLEECKAKVEADLAAEAATMQEYSTYCDDELKSRWYAIQTSLREMGELSATIADSRATFEEKSDEVVTLGTVIAGKERELYEATKARKAEHAEFAAAEAELLASVDETSRAVTALSKGMALTQLGKGKARKQLEAVRSALKSIVAAVSIDTDSSRKLKSFLQQTSGDSDDLSLRNYQPQAKMVAYESKSGSILQTIKDMQAKAEAELSDLRRKEMGDAHNFKVLEQGLSNEIEHNREKLASALSAKSAASEAQAVAKGNFAEASKTKVADEEFSKSLKFECGQTAFEWSERQKSATEETAAIVKAKEILISGVTAFSQVKVATKRADEFNAEVEDEDETRDEDEEIRSTLSKKFQTLGKKFHSFALMQMAGSAASDPFGKIRGLIEDMLAKLMKEAQEEANQKAFCDEEISKSKVAQKEKSAKVDKYTTRIDQATATMAELTEAVATLEAEIADIDKAQSEATKLRTQENAENTKAMKEFKDSADAVLYAMTVLKSFYEGSLLQTGAKATSSRRPTFGGPKMDGGSSIISVLEVAESDFTRLYAETETAEDQAAAAFKTMSDENKVSKATKLTDVKAKQSEKTSLEVQVSHHKEDLDSTSAELDAVNAYLEKLKPQCQDKAMSYEERKAAREAEIDGLKEALEILEGKAVALLQSEKGFLPRHRRM